MTKQKHTTQAPHTRITATDLQRKSGEILRRVHQGERFIVERAGYPVAEVRGIENHHTTPKKSR